MISNDDRNTWIVVAVLGTILGVAFWWTTFRKPAVEAEPAVAAPAMASAAPAAPAASAPAAPAKPGSAVAPANGVAMRGDRLPPDFSYPELNSKKQVRLSDFAGKVVLVDFWATWCGPCRMELPDFVKLQDQYKAQGFSFIGVSLDQQGPDLVRQFATQWKLNYPIIVDEGGPIANAYGGIRSIPTSVLVNRDGTVAQVFVGFRPKEVFEAEIKKALARSMPKPKAKAKA